jgi:hypothetical protein
MRHYSQPKRFGKENRFRQGLTFMVLGTLLSENITFYRKMYLLGAALEWKVVAQKNSNIHDQLI